MVHKIKRFFIFNSHFQEKINELYNVKDKIHTIIILLY